MVIKQKVEAKGFCIKNKKQKKQKTENRKNKTKQKKKKKGFKPRRIYFFRKSGTNNYLHIFSKFGLNYTCNLSNISLINFIYIFFEFKFRQILLLN